MFENLKLFENAKCKSWKNQTEWNLNWYIASDDETLVIVFRGTSNKDNERLNNLGRASSSHPGFKNVHSHEGWAKATMEIVETIRPYLKEQDAKSKRIMITGHSLGGALSGYTMFRLLRENQLIKGGNDVLVTSGAPRYAGVKYCVDPMFYAEYAGLLAKTGTTAFSAEMWFDRIIYAWTDGNWGLCTTSRIGCHVNYDPQNDISNNNVLKSIAANYCDSRTPKSGIDFHDHSRYLRMAKGAKETRSEGFELWPGDICVKKLYDNCYKGQCIATTGLVSRCAQLTVLPKSEKKVSGCTVLPPKNGKKKFASLE